ncbi:hypothetical protein LRX75_11420 [Rhizobium sp. DKSPLA3]|uniref:Uncharacterized protein n=1 Tax=Rhizobium quercicola TaxID=2901226 RepID=A0A9X1NSS6_9HYPH|nr:hypothetical protein [Rhizobium quercicola]MCD7109655.1 hypothetical protein [Rhizobium quercicola]
MIKYMGAVRAQQLIPGLRISNISMPYWGIELPEIEAEHGERVVQIPDEQHLDLPRMMDLAARGYVDRFNWTGYGQRLENFPDLDSCRSLFSRPDVPGVVLPDDCLVCPVRANEILDARNPHYTVIPVEFYADVAERTGLKPFFIGETADNVYVRALRERFPDSTFLPHQGVIEDFQTIRRSKHIVVPISSFAWLASWLSCAEKIILPVWGLFNRQINQTDLLPVDDARYEFYQFPPQPAVQLDEMLEAHKVLTGMWNIVEPQRAKLL